MENLSKIMYIFDTVDKFEIKHSHRWAAQIITSMDQMETWEKLMFQMKLSYWR